MTEYKSDIVEDFYGVKVADPYRWLEDDDTDRTENWIKGQNRMTEEYLSGIDFHDSVKERLEELFDYTKVSVPIKRGDRYFYFKNEGLKAQPILYYRDGIDGRENKIIDVNQLSEDGTAAITNIFPDPEGKKIAYSISKHGSDWQEVKIRNIETDQDYPEVIKWVKFTNIEWYSEDGFYYSRLPEPGSVPQEDQNNYSKVYYHTLNSPQDKDELIYEDPQNKELSFYPVLTKDNKYLILHVKRGTSSKNGIYYRRINEKAQESGDFIKLLSEMDAGYEFIGNEKNIFYIKTDYKAPKGRIIAIDIKNPGRNNWREIIPEQSGTLDMVKVINDNLAVTYMNDASHRLFLYDMQGNKLQQIDLPFMGSIGELRGERGGNEFLFGLTSFLHPTTVYCYNLVKNRLIEFAKPDIDFEPDQYETKQVFYSSKDGTKIPMFITCKKDLKLDGNNPTILYGYGGFKISMTPAFSPSLLHWMEKGGVYAVANLRGGGEYGEEWHQAGMLENKQNVFDDFITAGEWLIDNQYTSKEKLAIRGRSNGGLLTATCLTQRPDLYGAVISNVPVIDMLRYHKFTVGRFWIPEYGNAEKEEDFKFLYDYSPLHNISEGKEYPPTMIGTADTDDRVVPFHAWKFAATLQEAQTGDNPILLRFEEKAGHGFGKPTAKLIAEEADFYTFLFNELNGYGYK